LVRYIIIKAKNNEGKIYKHKWQSSGYKDEMENFKKGGTYYPMGINDYKKYNGKTGTITDAYIEGERKPKQQKSRSNTQQYAFFKIPKQSRGFKIKPFRL